jgi:hypothetical protein
LLKSDFFGNKNLGFQQFKNAEKAKGKKSKKRFKKVKKIFPRRPGGQILFNSFSPFCIFYSTVCPPFCVRKPCQLRAVEALQ